jgi:hexosaminidase
MTEESITIIPLPVEIKPLGGFFILSGQTVIFSDESNQPNAAYLREFLTPPTGFEFPSGADNVQENVIRLKCGATDERLGHEGYRLTVTQLAVEIEASSPAGVFYGIQSLRQLLPAEIERRQFVPGQAQKIPCVEIVDWPRFSWRGYMLDEGRHFQGKACILHVLDLMALQKLNVLHWHLTEDQGWRIEIRRYPKLTGVGSQRAGTSPGFTGRHDGVPHGGFYTQDEIREIVAYATLRQITIVPEIEMPGHSLAALAAYPELSCNGGPFEVATHFGIYPEIYCAGKEATFTFLQNVLDEVLELFPSPYIHIGGDEAPKKRWKECPDCQRRMATEGLKDLDALKVYFTNRIAAYLISRGRKVLGWNENLLPGLDERVAISYWLGNHKKLLNTIRSGRQVVISSFLPTYLDHTHSLLSLSKAYAFEPVFAELDEQSARNVLGVEPPLWSEFVRRPARVDYQTYPRLTAFAETGWTPRAKKDYAGFTRRLGLFLRRLEVLGVKYCPLKDAEPSKLSQFFGIFTIPQPQTKTAE